MSALPLAADSTEKLASVLSDDKPLLYVILAVSIVALGFAGLFAREVLAADQGPQKMRDISAAVQEGAAAYLNRQFRTLGVFAVVVFGLLFLLPADDANERIGRSLFGPLIVPFELTAPLLLVAIVGAVSIWRRQERAP